MNVRSFVNVSAPLLHHYNTLGLLRFSHSQCTFRALQGLEAEHHALQANQQTMQCIYTSRKFVVPAEMKV